MTKVKDLRDSFIQFFRERDHRIVPSSPLLPKDDPTLLFTTAGMVQFKPMFAGTVDLEYTRAASVQKCLRTSDLENVGKTKRHCTFFEMLGNFSFGDYFKKEAIEFAWDYSTNVIGFDKSKIWVSIFENDDEAFDLWRERTGIPAERIVRLGKADNFWGPAGDSGACGPCSELYIDRGPEFGCGSKDCKPGCECERFLEYWNLVFNQFNQDTAGNMTPLPKTGIDTGMGLERLATLIQGVESVYETDELLTLIDFVSRETGVKYEGANRTPINIIVEHSRALTFAMSDGIYPSNDGRGYVLRRVLRRALRFSRQIGLKEPFVYRMVDPLIKIMGPYYPEISAGAKNVKSVIESEERRFLETLENGMDRLEETMKTAAKQGGVIPGREAFLLYDTFGFPFEMTVEMAEEKGLKVDGAGYQAEMNAQRERGKQSWKGTGGDSAAVFSALAAAAGDTAFTGYETDSAKTEIKTMHNGRGQADSLSEGETGYLVLNQTPFYAESGGQVADSGVIFIKGGGVFRVEDVRKSGKTVIHTGRMLNGVLKKGDEVRAEIDSLRRNLIRANHTATHLLQAALRTVLGAHVKQAGSMVADDRMRFDFSHYDALTKEQIKQIETIVNEKIWEAIPVKTDIMDYSKAVDSGAMAVFDEKYEDVVRVISVEGFSRELCGGTHVLNTGQIGLFKILKESSPGAGMRRIEGTTLKGILDLYNEKDNLVHELCSIVNTGEAALAAKVRDLIEDNKSLEKEIARIKRESAGSQLEEIIKNPVVINNTKIFTKVFKGQDIEVLRSLSDSIRQKIENSLILFGSEQEGRPQLLFAADKKAVDAGIDCGKLIKEAVKEIGGGGGGRKDMAQAGGKDAVGLQKALDKAVDMLK
jgi:alanyl-tRNA synthetase